MGAAAKSNGTYVWRKLIALVPILFAVTFFTFYLTSLLPGDPAVLLLGPGATPEGVAELHERLHLDDPLLSRYFRWLGNAATGDLGVSPFQNQPVADAIGKALPVSLQLVAYAQVLALALSIPLGVLSAWKAESRLDRGISVASSFFLSMPGYVLAPLLIIVFSVGFFTWLPAARYVPFGESPVLHFKHMVLPVISLSMTQVAVYTRLLRTDMLATLKEEFINVAKAKGLSNKRILFVHALRPSSFALLTVLGINIGFLIGTGLIIETIFTLPGLGTQIATAVFQRDYLIIQGAVVVVAVGYVFANFVVDLLYAVLDPRVRHARAIA
ncbi:MAG: ABC transporter permease subunit [Acidimicrobiia bacterium]|nr:ABC transporter permease subunit [Acidimicrobiia bacterium]